MKALNLDEKLYQYIIDHCPDPVAQLAELRAETAKLPMAGMQIAQDQGAFLALLTGLIGAKSVLEVGCFTGYSSLCMASALPADGKLTTLDVSEDYTAIAKKYWQLAGLDHKIELQLGPALESLASLSESSFDLMFIDADKENMVRYYEFGLKLVRPGGLIIADNVLWGGSVVNREKQDPATLAIREFNDHVARDERVEKSMLNIADGLFLARRK